MRKSESNHESNNEELSNHIPSTGTGGTSTISQLPQILTRNSYMPSLSNLDAGDVVECYALMRTAKLENGLLVRKTALAFRYIHKSSSQDAVEKAPFELTLEYGPQRTGSTQSFESMPSINGRKRDLDTDGNGRYVTWENHAKIYYSLSISAHDWRNAYYMAPITGAVLSKVLNDYILDYTEEHPRYQPFTVIDQASGKVVLKSSSSEDFVWNVFTTLSNMYVSIKPILAPRRYAIELHVEDMKRDVRRLEAHILLEDIIDQGDHSYSGALANTTTNTSGKQNVANAAADFYSKLFSCIEAIKTGDYSQYRITPIPSASPSRAPSIRPSNLPTFIPTVTNAPTSLLHNIPGSNSTIQDGVESQNETQDKQSTIEEGSSNGENRRNVRRHHNRSLRHGRQRGRVDEDIKSTTQNQEQISPTTIITEDNNVLPFVDDANEAAEEAEKAAQVTKEAIESKKEDEAMVAASQAAEAAKKAAVATSKAAAETASESLLSGDGNLMVNVMSQCFSDPKYGIRSDIKREENRTQTSTDVFIYVDGSHYYKLNLTMPYLKISEFSNTLPGSVTVPNGKSDIIDIGLAFTIFIGLLFGFVVMLHQIKVIDWDQRLHFRWFFQPDADGVKKKGEYSHAPLEDIDDLQLTQEENGDFELSQPVSAAKYHSRFSSNIEDLYVTEEGNDRFDVSEPVIFSSRNRRSSMNIHF